MDGQHPGVKCSTGDFSYGSGHFFHRCADLTHYLNFYSGQQKVVRTHFECSCGCIFHRQSDLT